MRFHSHEGWLLEDAQKVTTRQYGSPEVLSGQPAVWERISNRG